METVDQILTRDFSGYGQTAPTRNSQPVGYVPTNNQDTSDTLQTQDDKRNLLISIEEKREGETFNEYTSNSAPNLNDDLSLEGMKSDWWKWFLALFCCLGLLYWFNRKF